MTARLDNWERLLGEYVESIADEPFEWGKMDCALFSLAAVEAITGVHPAPQYLGKYSTREGAMLALRDIGEGTLICSMDALFERCAPGKAGRGDLVMAQNAIGVCMGAFGLFLTETDGLARIPRAQFSKGWKV